MAHVLEFLSKKFISIFEKYFLFMNDDLFKKICGSYPTGVTVITSLKGNTNYGFTANSFSSVSIDPLLVLFCLNKEANSNKALNTNNFFIINILSSDQSKICNQFANNKLSPEKRFDGVETKVSKNNIKIISNSIAWIECKVKNIFDGGDHNIYLGEVLSGSFFENKQPLVYHNGMIKKII